MRDALIAGALVAACLWPAVDAAAAELTAGKLHLLIAMERLAARPAIADAPVFTRSASVSVTGRIEIVSPALAGPLQCTLFVGSSDDNTGQFHLEVKTAPVAVSGRVGTCTIALPFEWQNVTDDASFGTAMTVGNIRGLFSEAVLAPLPARLSIFPGPTLPLPLQGEDIHVNFDIRI
jgi:hypothetical protein